MTGVLSTMPVLAKMSFLQFPGGAKWSIGFLGLFHTLVGSLAIGFAFVVTVLQVVGYARKDRGYDLLAKRVQLWHVCIYNIGTINAIGLVFALSGLYPQFWSQIFVHFFWTLIVEEFLFFLLATTLTFHYFFWDMMWGHKRLHIFLGALLTPLFFLQFYIINGMGAFMLTPGFGEGQLSQWHGTASLTGYSMKAFYNPSFLMLTLHRTMANFAYAGFVVAAVCGGWLFLVKRPKLRRFYETGGRLAFYIAFACFLAIPIIGFFYAWELKYHAPDAYKNLMIGRGDVVAGGIDWWWVKHVIVASMVAMGLMFYRRAAKENKQFSLPMSLVYAMAALYLMFYLAMGRTMTWYFFWMLILTTVVAGAVALHLLQRHQNSGRAVFLMMGIMSFLTVALGGYVREASRPRFTNPRGERESGANRISHYSNIYIKPERQGAVEFRNVLTKPDYVPKESPAQVMARPIEPDTPDDRARYLIDDRCISCHTLERMRRYPRKDWARVVWRMRAYGMKLPMTDEEAQLVVKFLEAGGDY